MKYIILEAQTDGNGQTAFLPPEQENTEQAADSLYYAKLSAAAVSNVPLHTAFYLDWEGKLIASKYYRHDIPTPQE